MSYPTGYESIERTLAHALREDFGLPPSCRIEPLLPHPMAPNEGVRFLCFGCREEIGHVSELELISRSSGEILIKIGRSIDRHREKFNPTLADLIDWGWFDAEASA